MIRFSGAFIVMCFLSESRILADYTDFADFQKTAMDWFLS